MNAQELLKQLENKQVLIVGDVMLDRYLTGIVSRISPEAPVPIVLHRDTEDRLGGAANVALNIRALGSQPILCSVVGNDQEGTLFNNLLPAQGISGAGIVRSEERQTTVKTRVLGNNQQMLRIDREDIHELSQNEADALLKKIINLLDQRPVDALILQDYNKGVLSQYVIENILEAAYKRGILTAVDPKKNHFLSYVGVDLFKPNLKEIRDSAPFYVTPDLESLNRAASFLAEKLRNQFTMITLSEKGLYLNDGQRGNLYPTIPRNVADVSGAGDTVISIATLAMCAKLPMNIMAALSNLAGGQVCEFSGVVSVNRDILQAELEQHLASQK